MKSYRIHRALSLIHRALSLVALLVIVYGLLFWLFQPVGIPPVAQLHIAASVAGYLLLVAAGAGVAAMATVQFWKVLFLPRSAFHARELESLFGGCMVQVLGLAGPRDYQHMPPYGSRWRDEPRALNLLLDNPTEVVMGQLRSVADYILLRPEGFEAALIRLAGAAGEPAVKKYLDWKEHPTNTSGDSAASNIGSHEVLVEVRFFVEQYLNLIHVRLKEGWRWRVRVVAVVVAGSAGLLTVALSDLGPQAKVSAAFAAVIWGGFFSWLARDLVALVERRRA